MKPFTKNLRLSCNFLFFYKQFFFVETTTDYTILKFVFDTKKTLSIIFVMNVILCDKLLRNVFLPVGCV